jgi:hypothetical protein
MMSGAVTTAGRVTRREICGKHGVEYGQVRDPGIPGQMEAFWIGACRDCEVDFRREQQAAEELAVQVAEIIAEAERRIAADPELEKRIQELAAADLADEVVGVVANHCAMRRPEWENYHRDLEWNRVVAEIEAERKSKILAALQAAGR